MGLLKDIVWSDGSTANEAIELSNQIIANNNLYVILPDKKQLIFYLTCVYFKTSDSALPR